MTEQTTLALSPPGNTPGQIATPDSAQTLLEQALLAHWERRYAEAEALYQQALSLDPGLLLGRVRYAILLAQQERPGAAEAELSAAMKIDLALTATRLEIACSQEPDDEASLSLLGLLELYRNNLAMAQDRLNQALSLNPNNVGALSWLARLLVRQGKLTEAEYYLAQARLLKPQDAAIKAVEQVLKSSQAQGWSVQAEAEKPDLNVATRPSPPAPWPAPVFTPPTLIEVESVSLESDPQDELAKASQVALPGRVEPQPLTLEADQEAEQVRSREQVRQYLNEAKRLIAEEDYTGALIQLEQAKQLSPGDEEIREQIEAVKEEEARYQTVLRWLNEAQQYAQAGKMKEAFELLEKVDHLKPESPSLQRVRQQIEGHAAKKVEEAVERADQAEAPPAPKQSDDLKLLCPHCQAPLRPGAKFCSICGQKIAMPEPVELRCRSCGGTLRPQARFCATCGLPVN